MEKFVHDIFGIECVTCTEPIKGVRIADVKPGLVGDRHGLRVGDLIQACGNQVLCTSNDLIEVCGLWLAQGQLMHGDDDVFLILHMSILRSGLLLSKDISLRKTPDRSWHHPVSGAASPTAVASSPACPSTNVKRPLPGYSNEQSKLDAPYLGFAISIEEGPPQGCLVVSVEAGGPAEQAGFLVGDLIVGIQNKAVMLGSDLIEVYKHARPGDRIEFAVLRGNTILEVVLTIGSKRLAEFEVDDVITKLQEESERVKTKCQDMFQLSGEGKGGKARPEVERQEAVAVDASPEAVHAARVAQAARQAQLMLDQMTNWHLLMEATKMKLHLGMGLETATGNIRGVLVTTCPNRPDGFLTGDLIQACNDKPTSDLLKLSAEWCRAMSLQASGTAGPEGDRAMVTVLRNGRFLIERRVVLPVLTPKTTPPKSKEQVAKDHKRSKARKQEGVAVTLAAMTIGDKGKTGSS